VDKRITTPLAGCAICAVALVMFFLGVHLVGAVERLDGHLLARLSAETGSRTSSVAESIARLADPLPLALAAVCGIAVSWGRRREAIAAAAVVAGANLTTQLLKVVLAHPRYQAFLGDQQPWPTAFPSGHATAAWSIAAALMLVAPPRLRPLAVVVGATFACLVSISVVVLAWHYPSDVVGGILIVAGWSFAAVAGLRLTRPREPSPEAQVSSRFAISTK
jgi:membrane-associated phospholipid phosphatase